MPDSSSKSQLVTGGNPSAANDSNWTYPFRAIETNEPMHWNGEWLDRVLAMMRERGFNVLATHQNNLLDELTHLDEASAEGVGDLRRKKVYSRVAWMRRLARRLGEQSAMLYLEVKEPSFADYVLSLFPETIDKGGNVNPIHPIWEEIVSRKVSQVISALPELGGLIVSLSSPESRISPEEYVKQVGDKNFEFGLWLDRMIEAIRLPLSEAGMELIVRDFTYGRALHDTTISVLDRPREAMATSVKISPCDYFPDFPNNVAANRVRNVPVVVEFEAFGENTGWGVVPNCRVAELIQRMQFVEALGGKGFMVRINWEGVLGWSAVDGTSDVNIFALSKLAQRDPAAEALDIVVHWLGERYGLETGSNVAVQLARLLLESFDVIKKIYWYGNVFPRHSQVPLSWQQGWWSMRQHALTDWCSDGSHDNDFVLNEENRERLFGEKASASVAAERLASSVNVVLAGDDLPDRLRQELALPFTNLPDYVRAFELATQGAFWAARYEAKGQRADRTAAHDVGAEMADLLEKFEGRSKAAIGTASEHVSAVMFDPSHLLSFAASLEAT